MTKQEQIEAKKIKPFEVGDFVIITLPYIEKETKKVGRGKTSKFVTEETNKVFSHQARIVRLEDDFIIVEQNSKSVPFNIDKNILFCIYEGREGWIKVKKDFVSHTFYDCGANPFGRVKRRINFYNQDIQSLLFKVGFNVRRMEMTENDGTNRINFDPYIIDADGNKRFYQRGLIWTLEQKQLLIESIYQDIEIGKFLFRYNSWERMQQEAKENGIDKGHSFDCVDGKQRLNAIIEFVNNKFPDIHGNYWDDLSGDARRRFINFGNLSYGELPETATDQDVIDNFVTLNFTGVPMSKEHIEYVKSIKI